MHNIISYYAGIQTHINSALTTVHVDMSPLPVSTCLERRYAVSASQALVAVCLSGEINQLGSDRTVDTPTQHAF